MPLPKTRTISLPLYSTFEGETLIQDCICIPNLRQPRKLRYHLDILPELSPLENSPRSKTINLHTPVAYFRTIPDHDRIVSVHGCVINYDYGDGLGYTPELLIISPLMKRDLETAIRMGLDWSSR